jgi:protein tyrosine phosphatase
MSYFLTNLIIIFILLYLLSGWFYYKWISIYKPGMSYILDNIYLGNWDDSISSEIDNKDIKRILTLNKKHIHSPEERAEMKKKNIVYKYIKIEDKSDSHISDYFDEAIEFIKGAGGDPVLVHCSYGVSRSASIIIAYLIKEKNMTYEQALNYVKMIRPRINPNRGFRKELSDFAE